MIAEKREIELTPAHFRAVSSQWITGVAVVTTIDSQGNPYGLTMNSVTSLSIDPIQYLICVDDKASTLPIILESEKFCINILSDCQSDIAKIFASKNSEKFSEINYKRKLHGLPVLDDILAYISCKLVNVYQGGDHKILVGAVVDAEFFECRPLAFHDGKFAEYGL